MERIEWYINVSPLIVNFFSTGNKKRSRKIPTPFYLCARVCILLFNQNLPCNSVFSGFPDHRI